MFSWICPQCGHDVPPSKTECPYCAERAQQAALATQPITPPAQFQVPAQNQAPQYQQAPPTWQPPPPPPPPQPVYQQAFAPPQYQQPYPPPPPQYQQHPQQPQQPMAWPPPQQKTPPPAWLVGGGFAVALILVFGGIYYFMSKGDTSSAAPKAATAAAAKAVASPLQRSIEVAGLRFVSASKGSSVKFVVINHSTAPVSDLQGTVTLWAGTTRSDEDAIGTFNLNVDVVEAGGSKEMTAPLKTKLKPYEMPDWQNATAEVQINAQQ